MLKKIQALFAPKDLTVGSPMAGIAMFAVPLLIGNLAQQMYNTVDAIVVGRYVGDDALGAVGLGGIVLNLILVLFMGISTGATIVVSQYFGAKDREKLSRAVGTTITLTVISGLVMTVIGIAFIRPLLILLDTPASMLDLATDYLVIIMVGLVSSGLYNILSGVMRGMGDSVSPLLYLMVACGLCASNGEARRLIQQGGVAVDERKITDPSEAITAEALTNGVKIRKGKKVFHKALLG